jgi:hypothetical protein
MILLGAVAAIVVVGFWFLLLPSRSGSGLAPLILSTLPLALLFVITPVPMTAVEAVRGFQALGASGHAGVKEAARLALDIIQPLWIGSLAFAVAIAIAATLQLMIRPSNPAASQGRWGTWFVVASSLLVVPVGILSYLLQGVAGLVMQAAAILPPTAAGAAAANAESARFVEAMSSRLLLAGLAGFPLLLAVLVFGLGNLFAVRFSETSDGLERFSWTLFAAAGICAVWNVVALSLHMQSLMRALG